MHAARSVGKHVLIRPKRKTLHYPAHARQPPPFNQEIRRRAAMHAARGLHERKPNIMRRPAGDAALRFAGMVAQQENMRYRLAAPGHARPLTQPQHIAT